MRIDLVNLLFWLHDAQIGVAAQIKDSGVKYQTKMLFNRLWTATRELKKWVNQATTDIEREKALESGIVEDSFADAAEYIILAVEAKLNADRLGIGNALIKTLENFRDEH